MPFVLLVVPSLYPSERVEQTELLGGAAQLTGRPRRGGDTHVSQPDFDRSNRIPLAATELQRVCHQGLSRHDPGKSVERIAHEKLRRKILVVSRHDAVNLEQEIGKVDVRRQVRVSASYKQSGLIDTQNRADHKPPLWRRRTAYPKGLPAAS